MKKLFAIAFLFVSVALYSQDNRFISLKNHWLIGGSANIYGETVGYQARLIVSIEPQAGYFINNWFALGIRTPFSFTSDAIRLSTTPFTRFYLPLSGRFLPFAEVNGGRSWRFIYDTRSQAYDDRENIWILGTRLGGAIFLRENISFDTYLFYTGLNRQTIKDGRAYQPNFSQEFGMGMAFQIYF